MSYSLDEQGSWEQEKERADSPSRGQSLCQHWWCDTAPDSQVLIPAESTYSLVARTAEQLGHSKAYRTGGSVKRGKHRLWSVIPGESQQQPMKICTQT